MPGHARLGRPRNGDAPFSGSRFLVVDDNQLVREQLARVLRRRGGEVVTASDGRQGIELAGSGIHVILMDLQMPVCDGFAAVAEMRRRGVTIPILAMTGMNSVGLDDSCVAAGFDDIIAKPYEPAGLCAMLARYAPSKNIEEGPRPAL